MEEFKWSLINEWGESGKFDRWIDRDMVGWLVEVKRVKCEWNAIDFLGIL